MSPYQVGALVICLLKFGSQAEGPWSIILLVNFARILGQKKIIASYVETVDPWCKSRVRHPKACIYSGIMQCGSQEQFTAAV
ncbi:hypothetical protein N7533_007768 [Penicillium manginii]|uniref:uncharacterized protein n=1 Tax=Penicillium manginii TaxID=203109 RepID=UPI002549ADB1|nr:uncharacterized protein N7533_007768 [Penicillium manginii]KAJ5750740.1 hypothetical protein N7533_007768 [Penicillium manginii]